MVTTEHQPSSGVTAFACTEVAHGSNLREVGNEVHLIKGDTSSKSIHFVVKTPSTSNAKFWPRNLFSARSVEAYLWKKRMKAFIGFASTYSREILKVNVGYQDIVLEILGRRAVTSGYNGVENGCIQFHNMCVPVDSLLCEWAQIKEDGFYISDVPKTKRFTQCCKNFYFERFGTASAVLGSALCGLMIALKYSEDNLDRQARKIHC